MSLVHRTTMRALALGFAGALALGACGSTTTATTASTTTAVAASPTTTVAGQATTTTIATTAGSATSGKAQLTVVSTPYGKAIGRGDGHVLYAWDKEAEAGNTVKCVEAKCVEKWPPLIATDFTVGDGLDAKSFSLVDRPDGTKQVSFGGKRLYAMSADEAGDANCQGTEGWWILNPDGTKNANKTAAKP